MSHPKYERLIADLREHANSNDIDHSICDDCDDAADAIQRMQKLLDAIDGNEPHMKWKMKVLRAREELR